MRYNENEINLISTFNMLNCSKDHNIYIYICIFTFWNASWPKQMKLTMEQQYVLSVLHIQVHARWCSGDFSSQVISMHGIYPQKPEYSVSSIGRVRVNQMEANGHETQSGLWVPCLFLNMSIFSEKHGPVKCYFGNWIHLSIKTSPDPFQSTVPWWYECSDLHSHYDGSLK